MARVLDVLALLARHRDGLTLTELSAELSVPKSTFVDTLRALCSSRYLLHQDGTYRIGTSAYKLASSIMACWSAPDAIRRAVHALAAATNESVGYAIADWEIGQVIYTDAVNSTQPVRYEMRAGLRAPLYASAAGRVLLAFADPGQTQDYLAKARLKALTPTTRTTPEAIQTHLEQIRRERFCASFGEMLDDTAALSVPVLDPEGAIIGALMVAAPLDRMRANYPALHDALIAAGSEVSC